ncbi:hypothetical protein [Candidatus Chloroploca sp. Khr17]|uniref:hypothetical protein n=1 Tax=Candidatus Chloroploca sp. Khr17 TaxID=2496869 RepID=UPI00101CC7A6|nr:hypothetical protein [Candidatus Chloroploca sp. Khr17]
MPDIEEQQQLLDYVREHTVDLDNAIAKALKEIDLIREYRTRLIADVVTGKLDVRGVDLAAYGDELAGLDEALADEEDVGEQALELVDEAEESVD